MPIGFVDIGTNMAKLLVAEWQNDALHVLHHDEHYIRLGEGMTSSGRIKPGALERLRLGLLTFKAALKDHGGKQLFAAATSAVREAENRATVSEFVLNRTGVPMEILSERQEAQFTFLGAVHGVESASWPAAVIDIGGGSTEIAVGSEPRKLPQVAVSLPVGTVRLTEAIMGEAPVDEQRQSQARERIAEIFDASEVAGSKVSELLAGAATVRILAALNGTPDGISLSEVKQWRETLCSESQSATLARAPDQLKGRADVFPAGVLILEVCMEKLGVETCRVSPYRLVHGYAINHFRGW